jgi:hypothetical protein
MFVLKDMFNKAIVYGAGVQFAVGELHTNPLIFCHGAAARPALGTPSP